jgi:hypothetical protein
MARLLRAPFVLAIFTSCSSDPQTALRTVFDPCQPVVAAPDAMATPAERASVEQAIQIWRHAAALEVTLDAAPHAPSIPIHFQAAAGAFHGLYDDHAGEIFVNQDLMDPNARAITIAHELGHAFGLLHVVGRPSLMNPGNTTVPPTAEDIATLAASWGACATGKTVALSSADSR